MSKKSFIKGAAVLAAAAVIIKVIGAVYRIVLGNFMPPEATSYYSTVYPWYNALLAIASVAVPAAIARMVSERNAVGNFSGGVKVVNTAFKMMIVFGLLGSSFLFFGAETFSNLVGNPGAATSFKTLSIAVLFVSMMAVLRGYFQGIQTLRPFAISQVMEQIGRVSFGFVCVFAMLSKGDEWIAAGATLGAPAGAFIGLITIAFFYFRYKKKSLPKDEKDFEEESTLSVAKTIVVISVPIAMGYLVGPLLNMIDTFIVINRLTEVGFGEMANDMFSYIAYYSVAIINLPQVLITAIQISLLPAVAEMYTVKNMDGLNKLINIGIKVAAIIGIPAAVGIMTLSGEILALLYPARPEVIANAASVLAILSISIIFMALYLSTTGILQGIGKQLLPARNLFFGACAKVVFCYVLVGNVDININGAAISTVIAYFIAVTLNVLSLSRYVTSKRAMLKVVIKPAVSAAIMGVLVKVVLATTQGVIGLKLATVLSILVGGGSYLVLLLFMNTFTEDDYEFIPGSKYIRRAANFFGR